MSGVRRRASVGAWIVGCAAVPLPGTAAQPRSGRSDCVVKLVKDGDTFRCSDGRRVRLLQVDAPAKDQTPFDAAALAALAFVGLADGRMANEELARQGAVVLLA